MLGLDVLCPGSPGNALRSHNRLGAVVLRRLLVPRSIERFQSGYGYW